MLSNELLEQVKALNDDDKLALLRILYKDPALKQYAYDPMGLRTSPELAQNMLALVEQMKESSQPVIE